MIISAFKKLAVSGLLLFSSAFATYTANGQCAVDEVLVHFVFTTDNWGYEVYWELYPAGSTCGQNTILWGGNLNQVGCNGGGQQNATNGNGYANNATIETEPICLLIGQPLTFQYIDDWGDGGFTVSVFENNEFVAFFTGTGTVNTWAYTPGALLFPTYNMPCNAETILIDGPSITLNNQEANVMLGEPAPPGGSCQNPGQWCEGGLNRTVWARFQAPASGSVELSTCNAGTNFDTKFALWKVEECNNFSTYQLINANDDIPGGCGPGNGFSSRMRAGCLEPGEWYYVQIDGYQGASGNAVLTLSTYAPGVSLSSNVTSMPCAVGKGEQGEGSIQVVLNGYGINFTSTWTGPDGFTAQANTINNLNPGLYSVEVSTTCDEVFSGSFEITMPQPLITTLALVQPECELSMNGSATVNITGGTAPFSFLWEGPNNYTSTATVPANLGAGQHEVTIIDANGCEADLSFMLTATNDIAIDLGPNQTICTDESLLLFAPVGYQYTWQDSSVNQFFYVEGEAFGEGAHTFIVTVSNPEGCSATDAITITVEQCTGAAEQHSVSLQTYPNPTNGPLTLVVNEAVHYALFNLHGKRLFEGRLPPGWSTLDLAEYASGVYLLMLTDFDGKHVATERIIRQ